MSTLAKQILYVGQSVLTEPRLRTELTTLDPSWQSAFSGAAQDALALLTQTAKLLQVTNSAALGLRHKVTRVQDAISYLGLETTRSLVLLAHTFSYCDKTRAAGFSIERLWQHSLTVGALARCIAREEKA